LKYQLATTGIEHNINKYMLSDGSIIYCSIIDTSGTERFRALNDNYYRQADGCILVYDITNERSFEEIRDYYIPKLKVIAKVILKQIFLEIKMIKMMKERF
jgi:GTPase SAR1 family protein